MKQIWHKKEREPRDESALNLVFKFNDGTYYVDVTSPPIKYNNYYDIIEKWCYAEDLVEQIERLQEQLNEANKTIKKAQELCPDKSVMLLCNPARPSFGMMTNDVLTKYLEKWGVK